MKNHVLTLFLISLFYTCSDTPKNIDLTVNEKVQLNKEQYVEFQPDAISSPKIDQFKVVSSHIINDLKIITGRYINENIDFSAEEPLDDYGGFRLIVLNSKNEIIYQSRGMGELYLFHPYFYKNESTQKILIICQLAFEYFCGGEAFLIDNGQINVIGNLDIESTDMEVSLTDIIKINEINNQIIFEFQRDSLIVNPGGKEKMIKNIHTRYIFKNDKLTFHE